MGICELESEQLTLFQDFPRGCNKYVEYSRMIGWTDVTVLVDLYFA